MSSNNTSSFTHSSSSLRLSWAPGPQTSLTLLPHHLLCSRLTDPPIPLLCAAAPLAISPICFKHKNILSIWQTSSKQTGYLDQWTPKGISVYHYVTSVVTLTSSQLCCSPLFPHTHKKAKHFLRTPRKFNISLKLTLGDQLFLLFAKQYN